MVARGGVEPPTFRFSVGRSYQLSYLAVVLGEIIGRAPFTPTDPRLPHVTVAIGAARSRTLVGLCIAMGVSLTVAASFNFLLTPMLEDLGLSQDNVSVALTIPSLASLLVVFVAGLVGERRGHRTVITWMSVLFIVGSVLVAITPGIALLVTGLLFAGIAATAIQIVVFGLLSNEFQDPGPRARAFGTFGMVSPFIWLVLPVITGVLVAEFPWRAVPWMWAIGGVGMLVASRTLLPTPSQVRPTGSLWAPMFAGLTVVLAVQTLALVNVDDPINAPFIITAVATVVSAMIVMVLLRRQASPNFSLRTLRQRRARSLLLVVVIIPLINTVFLMTIAFQYLYGLTVLETAVVMVPAQIAAVLGTRLIAAPLMARFGVTRTAASFFVLLAVAMLVSFAVRPQSPLWVPITYVAVYNVLTVAASITVTSGLMSTSDPSNSGEVSAYRGSGVALGQMLAVVLMNSLVFRLGIVVLDDELIANGLGADEASDLVNQIEAASKSVHVMSHFSQPLPSGIPVEDVMKDAIAAGLHINGVAGAVLALVSVALILRSVRRERTPREVAPRH